MDKIDFSVKIDGDSAVTKFIQKLPEEIIISLFRTD